MIGEILEKAPEVRAIVIGDVMLDRYQWGTVARVSPEAPVPVVRLESETVIAGGAANVAANIVGLGASAKLFGVIGDDPEGGLLRSVIGSSGVSADDLVVVPGRPTSVKTRVVAHSQHVVRIDREVADALSPPAREILRERVSAALEWSDVVVVSDYAKGVLGVPFLALLLAAARAAGKPVLVDPKGKDYSKYAGATVVTPNRREALDASGLEDDTNADEAGGILVGRHGFGAVLVTLGEKGMVLFEAGRETRFPARARNVYDVTGAGDTVIASLGVALAAGIPLAEAVGFANLAAGIVVERVGTTAITREMLTERSLERPEIQ